MSGRELLARLDQLGIVIVAEAGKLKVSAARGQLDDGLKEALAANKTELLQLLAARQPDATSSTEPVPRIDRDRSLPLSYFQERLWVMQRLEPESTAFNIVTTWRVPEGSDADRVVQAVADVLSRHEILRATFIDEGGAPRVRLLDAPASVEVTDLRALSSAEQEDRVRGEIAAASRRPFDLAREAPARCAVYRLGAARAKVLIAAHHIAIDVWSLDLLRRELTSACAKGSAAAADELQYVDFAAWQRRTQDGRLVASELDWWVETLKGAPQLSTFPPDRKPLPQPSGATLSFTWDAAMMAALHALVREEGATVYMALLAACAAVLRAYTGQGDVVLGIPMGVRERPEFETMIGPFVNVQVLRLDLNDDPSFAQLLRRARNGLLDAHEHRRVPFETLVERIKPPRSLEHGPLFQVAVVQHPAPLPDGQPIFGGGALHDLTWFAREVDGRLEGDLEYRSDFYTAQAIERIAAQLQTLLRSAVLDRHCPLSRISLLAEHDRLLAQFNATAADLESAPFSVQFERRATLEPGRVAVAFEGHSLTYAALNRRANQLARYLRGLGIAPGGLVAVCLDRSLDLVVVLIAIQKAGGAYVPLDPGFPADRLAFMLEDSGAEVLLTGGNAGPPIDLPSHVRVVDPIAQAATLATQDDSNLCVEVDPNDPVYVIYTSGSTGRPKGVVVPHGALANFLGSMAREPGLGLDDVIAAVTTISFDIAGLELYLPLIVGARVELVSRDTARDGAALARTLAESGATVLQATPSTWRMLIESGWRPKPSFRAFCGGEALPRDLAKELLDRVPELWNLYGPTETTIWSTAERVAGPDFVSIGRPIANTQVWVVGAHGAPMPVGMAGEIWIGGAGVATGYHRRPELTAERFVADPFSEVSGARIYRTGDLGHWDAQGRLHHLGRLDHQVKVRGFRVELEEIESELAGHPAVRQCVARACEASPGDARVVAYVVFEPGEELTVSEIRRFLRRQVPEYMVPSVIVALDAIPLTPNGKIDRAALPDPYKSERRSAANDVPPDPGMEQLLADIWRDFLKTGQVGAHDNFFELGGHSLLSLRVAATVEQKTGWRMDPRAMFFQTLRQVAAGYPGHPSNRNPENP